MAMVESQQSNEPVVVLSGLERLFWVGNHKQVLDPNINATVFLPKQLTQAQFGG